MPFSTTDTIVAIATPPGRGGLGVVRVSGPRADSIARQLTTREHPFVPRHATLSTVVSAEAVALDRALVTFFPSPGSYTGEDTLEISAHGSPVVLNAIIESAIHAGARLAAPGEFTLRAYLNGRVDLAQAEAIADLIDAATPLQARSAFDQLSGTVTTAIGAIDQALFDLAARLEASVDFPDEGYHFVENGELIGELDAVITQLDALLTRSRSGRLLREGRQVVIVGAPNAGKSSLFNALVGADRAIVTSVPGTTRDLVTEVADFGGIRVTLVDTAGLRDTDDPVESQGVERSMKAIDVADLILEVSDLSQAALPSTVGLPNGEARLLRVGTKSDLPRAWTAAGTVEVSSRTGEGIAELRRQISTALDHEPLMDLPTMTNVRHFALVDKARVSLVRAREAAHEQGEAFSEEFLLADLQEARGALEEVTGRRTTDDLLAHVFSKFCIGK